LLTKLAGLNRKLEQPGESLELTNYYPQLFIDFKFKFL